jgi:hypothetical protein
MIILLLEQCAGTFTAMGTATALFFSDSSQVRMVMLVVMFFKEAVGLCFLLCLTEVYAFLFGVVWFV